MKKSLKDEIDHFFDKDIYTPSRTVYLGSASYSITEGESGTDGAMAERLIKALHLLEADAPEGDKPIVIIMNNPGGDFYHGLAIYDAIKACKNHVTIKVFGQAMSMGAVILQAADHRILAPNARIMIHYGSMSLTENSKTFIKWAEECKKTDSWMEELFLGKIRQKHPEYPLGKVKQMCSVDTILNPVESVNLGLADEIMTPETT